MFVSILRITKFAGQNFWRNFWLSLITISMLVLTLLTINVLLVLNLVTDKAIEYVEQRIEVSVYFNAGVEQEKVTNTAGYLRDLPQVRDVETITAAEAYDRFQVRHAGDTAILTSLEEIGDNPFGPTLVVKAFSANDFPFILSALDNPQFRDAIRDKDFSSYEEVISRIRYTTDRIRLFGLGLSVIFLLIAMLIVFNTVRMGIFTHREEIGIMKLVGASNWFVRAPFLLEVIGYSLLSTVIMAALMYPTIAFMETRFDSYFDGQATHLLQYFEMNGWMIFGAQFLAVALISMIATGFAMRKYLKV
ncbi:ABC transporter permease [Patescibacteria group bacterium]|nr:ABC transporter permease [Patescibacteria group bacterium]MBU1705801.1 ABC transporter permease [Patescibacteria group bacterium]